MGITIQGAKMVNVMVCWLSFASSESICNLQAALVAGNLTFPNYLGKNDSIVQKWIKRQLKHISV